MTETPTADAVPFSDEEGFEITQTGLVHMRIDSVDYWLRRPKIGQMREIEDAFVAASSGQLDLVQQLASDTIAATTDEQIDADPEAAVAAATDAVEQAKAAAERILAAALNAWRLAVDMLERDGKKLPAEDDEMPPWLGTFATSNAMRQGWRRIPWLAAPPQ